MARQARRTTSRTTKRGPAKAAKRTSARKTTRAAAKPAKRATAARSTRAAASRTTRSAAKATRRSPARATRQGAARRTRAASPGAARGATNAALLKELEDFVINEARLLDERRFEEWESLFTADGIYWVPAIPDQESPRNHVSLYYDNRLSMRERIMRLRHPEIHAQTPASRTCHLVTNVRLESVDNKADEYVVFSSVMMLEYRPGWEQQTYGGHNLHTLCREKGELKIKQKRVNLINCDATMPAISVPF